MAFKLPTPWALVAGKAFEWQGTWYDTVDGNGDPTDPVNLTGYSGRCQGRVSAAATPASWDLDDGDLGGVVLGGVAGTVQVTLSSEDTAGLAGVRGVVAIDLVTPGGETVELARGEWYCDAAIVYDDPEPEPAP